MNNVSPLLRVDDGHLLTLLATWIPDVAGRHTLLVDSPATLMLFEQHLLSARYFRWG
jgi:hypothetical protein